MKVRGLHLLLLCFIFILGETVVLAQNVERPKVGLVLSGGGAKGLAHIGVLKAMEEAGLYPDYITGTSMGSIIGGLYAMGYSADELKEIGLNINWDVILSNSVELNKVAIEEKAYYGRYISEFPIRDGKIGLPQGVIDGQELTLMLNRLTRPAHGINDFHDLPIPFECLAADVENGVPVVLRKGSLPQALRASMAIPTIFTPVIIDDKLLVDGGLLRNFPVQEVRAMGADIVIGVSVSTGLQPKEELNSMVDVLAQSAFVASAKDTEAQTRLVDVFIEPDIADYSTVSFWSSEEIVAAGEKTGKAYSSVFKALADSLNQFGQVRVPEKLVVQDVYSFNSIEIAGNDLVSEELIKGKLQIKPNQQISITELEDRLNLLYGTLYFSKVFYTIDEENNSLLIQVKEAPPGHLKLALHYDTDNKAGINLNLTLRNLLLPSSRLIAEFDLAQNPNASVSYYKYIGKKQRYAFKVSGDWVQSEIPGYLIEEEGHITTNKNLNNILNDNYVKPSLGIQGSYKTNSTAGIAIEYIEHKISPEVLDSVTLINESDSSITAAFNKIVNKDWAAHFYYQTNTLNKPFFPNSGILANLDFYYIFGRGTEARFDSNLYGEIEMAFEDKPMLISSFRFKAARPLARSLTTSLTVLPEFGITMAATDSSGVGDILYRTFIGGSRPYGLLVHSYEATPNKRFDVLNFAYISVAVQWEFIKNFYFTARTDYLESEYPMKWINSNVVLEKFGVYSRRLGFSGKLSYNSVIGPVEIGIGKDQYIKGVNVFFGFGYYIKDR